MTQNEFRAENHLTLEALGALMGRSSVTMSRYENGRIPNPAAMAKIYEVTGGQVTPNDYHSLHGPEAVAET